MANIEKYKENEFLQKVVESLPKNTEFTEEELKDLNENFSNLKHGAFAELPLTCQADSCPYAKTCILHKMGKSPEGEKCPIELAEIAVWTGRWMEGLDINQDDIAQLYLVKELVEAELMQARTNKTISMEGYIKEIITSVDPVSGKAYINYDISVPMQVKFKFKARVDKILKSLAATREDRIKYGIKAASIPNRKVESIAERIQKGEIQIVEVKKSEDKK